MDMNKDFKYFKKWEIIKMKKMIMIMVQSNLDENDSVERWEQRNLEWAKEMLKK